VVVHQAVGVADPMISLMDMLQHVQKVDAVLIVSENSLLFVAAGGEVIDSTCVFYAKGARHAGTLAQKRENVKTKDLTLVALFRKALAGQLIGFSPQITQQAPEFLRFNKEPVSDVTQFIHLLSRHLKSGR